jgi:hypothetical protein
VRHNPSTVVVLAGKPPDTVLSAVAKSLNVVLVRPERDAAGAAAGGRAGPGAGEDGAGLEAAVWALRRAAGISAPYVLVAADPLAAVAAEWQAMWEITAQPRGAADFEIRAAQALAAWRAKQFELPDYYLVVAAPDDTDTGPDLYLGPLRAARPRRVAVTGTGDRSAGPGSAPATTASLLDTLRSLEHGPWWPPLDELIDAARRFHAGGLAETQQARYS